MTPVVASDAQVSWFFIKIYRVLRESQHIHFQQIQRGGVDHLESGVDHLRGRPDAGLTMRLSHRLHYGNNQC